MGVEEMVKLIAEKFGAADRISLPHTERLLKLLDAAPEEALVLLVKNRVKFVRVPAGRRLIEKFGWSNERLTDLVLSN